MTKTTIPKNVENFINSVINPFNVAIKGTTYTYLEYLSLPQNIRSNDEADVVDVHFTELALEWLGFYKSEGRYKYNTTTKAESQRPDFVALGTVGTAFIWEDKNTTHDFDEVCLNQLTSYTAGTSGYAIWSNAKQLIGFHFDAKGMPHKLVDVDVALLIEYYCSPNGYKDAKYKEQVLALDLFYILFSHERFTSFNSLMNKICIDEATFLKQAVPISTTSERTQFISGARQVLEHFRLLALQSINEAQKQQAELPNKELALRQEWLQSKTNLLDNLSGAISDDKKEVLRIYIERIELKLGALSDKDFLIEDTLKLKSRKLCPINFYYFTAIPIMESSHTKKGIIAFHAFLISRLFSRGSKVVK